MEALDSLIVEFDLSQGTFQKKSIESFSLDAAEKNKIYWMHCNLNQPETLKHFAQLLQLPDKVLQLCLEQDAITSLIDTDETLTIKMECLLSAEPNPEEQAVLNSLVLHITDRYCFTAAKEPIAALKEFEETYHKAIKYAKTPCFILFLLFDAAVNDYAKILLNFELIIENLDTSLRNTKQNMYEKVMDIKQQIMKIKRYAIAIREILTRISGRKSTVISEACHESLHNLSNHTHMIIHEMDSIRDMLNSMLSQIDNSLMQKMNETMRILTTFAAIFLPLSLITGIYGMNFQRIPELAWKYGYFYALGLITLCGVGLFVVFKKMKWF